MQVHHKDLLDQYEHKRSYEVQRLKLIHSCVEINGRPLIALEDSGYQNSIEFQLKYLAKHGCKLTINAKTVKPHIEEMANEIRKKIKIALNGKVISVMADIATKNHRGILSINAQYYSAGRINLITLGMLEMNIRHTAENIKDMIVELLNEYEISIDQVYSFTADNAASMKLTAKLLNAAADEFVEDEADDYGFDPTGDFASHMQQLAVLIGREYRMPSVIGVGCAAH